MSEYYQFTLRNGERLNMIGFRVTNVHSAGVPLGAPPISLARWRLDQYKIVESKKVSFTSKPTGLSEDHIMIAVSIKYTMDGRPEVELSVRFEILLSAQHIDDALTGIRKDEQSVLKILFNLLYPKLCVITELQILPPICQDLTPSD